MWLSYASIPSGESHSILKQFIMANKVQYIMSMRYSGSFFPDLVAIISDFFCVWFFFFTDNHLIIHNNTVQSYHVSITFFLLRLNPHILIRLSVSFLHYYFLFYFSLFYLCLLIIVIFFPLRSKYLEQSEKKNGDV